MSNKAKISITAAAALVAVLVLVLCIMGGVFNFSPSEKLEGGTLATPDPAVVASDFVPNTDDISGEFATPPPVEEVIPQIKTYSISVIAGKGGVVSPRGSVEVNEGESASFSIIPDEQYEIFQIIVDGEVVDTVDVYSFTDVTENHTLYVVFAPETIKESQEPIDGGDTTDDPEDDFDDFDYGDDNYGDSYPSGRRGGQGIDP